MELIRQRITHTNKETHLFYGQSVYGVDHQQLSYQIFRLFGYFIPVLRVKLVHTCGKWESKAN